MLRLFKGELTYREITRGMTFKEMLALRDARIEQLKEDAKDRENAMSVAQLENIREEILRV